MQFKTDSVVRGLWVLVVASLILLIVIHGISQGAEKLPVYVVSSDDDGLVFLRFPVLRSVEISVETMDGLPAKLEEGNYYREARIEPGENGEDSLVIVEVRGYGEEKFRVKSILLRY